jgi:hypothetical protein
MNWNDQIPAMIFGAATAYIAATAAIEYNAGIASEKWTPTTAHVISNETPIDWTRKHTSYKPQVVYSYAVNGMEYRGNRISFPEPTSSDLEPAKNRISKYPANSDIQIYYSPSNPRDSTIENGVEGSELHFKFLCAGIFLVVTVIFAINGAMMKRQRSRRGNYGAL